MKIDLTELLRDTGNEQDIEEILSVSFPEDGLEITKPVKVRLRLVNAGESIIVTGTIETNVKFSCSRCLKEFESRIKVDIEELFSKDIPVYEEKIKELELDDSDIVFKIESDNTIDLTEAIRQDILTALPIKPLCSDTCKIPGLKEKKKTIDPRLEKLKEFKKK